MPLQPGTRLGPYQITEPLGAGGMGEVYRARDTRLDRSVAIKVMPPHLASVPELRERFEREARTISSLNHPHICALYDVGSQDSLDYLVMEYLEGQTLADRLAAASRSSSVSTAAATPGLKLDEALTIALQVADALDQAHRQGVVHRDLKPGNIMLTSSGAKLLDFGLAKQAQPALTGRAETFAPTTPQPLTGQGTILGTLQYMAPEQLEGREADARTDVFAFGAVLHEMVTGRRAFDGKTHVSLIAAIVDHDPPPVSSLVSLSPPLLDHVVRNCLAKNPDRRWQSIADVAIELRLVADSLGATAPRVLQDRSVRQLRVARLTAAMLAAVLVAGSAALGVWWLRNAEPERLRLQFDVSVPAANSPNQLAVSPTGRHIATLAARGGTIWIGSLDRDSGNILRGTEGASWPFWSPDGRFVAFFSGGKLKRVDLDGAPPQTLCDASSGLGGAWNRDGVIVFAPDAVGPLFRVSAAGGSPTPLTSLDRQREEISHRHPAFLPDGRHFIYVAFSRKQENSGLYLASLDSAEPRLLVHSPYRAVFAAPDHLLFMRGTTLMAQRFDMSALQLTGEASPVVEGVGAFVLNSAAGFSTSANGVLVFRSAASALTSSRHLNWVDREGTQTPVLDGPARLWEPALSPDSSRVAIGRVADGDTAGSDLWLIDLTRGTQTRFTFDPAHDDLPSWSPDATTIVFQSRRGTGVANLYRKRATGIEHEELLLESDENKAPQDWSPDGKLVLYSVYDPKTNRDLWVVPVTGEGTPQPVVRSPFHEYDGRFSPDGEWLAYVSEESGRAEVYALSYPDASTRIQISTAGGDRPRWRKDGKELFFLEPAADERFRMMAVDITISGDGTMNAGLPRKLFDTTISGRYDVTPDGKRFLITVPAELTSGGSRPLTVLVNWNQPPR